MARKKRLTANFGEKPKPSLFGGFTMPPILSSDENPEKTDKYINDEPIPSRHLGANMTTKGTKHGKGPDAYLDGKFLTLASRDQFNGKEVDPYVTTEQLDRQRAAEAKKKWIGDGDFIYPSVPKKSTGPGSFYGTFGDKEGKPYEHMKDYDVPTKDDVPPAPKEQPPNFYCNPPKKGTFGVPGTTFGPKELFEHKADGWEETKELQKAAIEKELAARKKISEDVWKIPLKPMRTFDEKKGNTGVSCVYDEYEKPPEKPKRKSKLREKKWPGKPFVPDDVWKAANPPKQGVQGYISGYPNKREEGMEDPYNAGPREPDAKQAKKLARKKKKEPKPIVHDAPFSPFGAEKTSCVRSLLRRFV